MHVRSMYDARRYDILEHIFKITLFYKNVKIYFVLLKFEKIEIAKAHDTCTHVRCMYTRTHNMLLFKITFFIKKLKYFVFEKNSKIEIDKVHNTCVRMHDACTHAQ